METMNQSIEASELPKMMTLKQAAEVLEVSVGTIRNWIGDETLPAYRIGPRLIRVLVKDVQGLITVLKYYDDVWLDG